MKTKKDNPPEDDDIRILDEAQEWAASVGYKESDVNDIIKSIKERKNKTENCHKY